MLTTLTLSISNCKWPKPNSCLPVSQICFFPNFPSLESVPLRLHLQCTFQIYLLPTIPTATTSPKAFVSPGPEPLLHLCPWQMILLQCSLELVTPQLKALQWLPGSLKIQSPHPGEYGPFFLSDIIPSPPLPILPPHCAAWGLLLFLRYHRPSAQTIARVEAPAQIFSCLAPSHGHPSETCLDQPFQDCIPVTLPSSPVSFLPTIGIVS